MCIMLWSAEDDDSTAGSSRPAASLHLSQEQLSEFGGVRQVVAHFKVAPTAEACHNLLVVLLDQATHNITQASYVTDNCKDHTSSPMFFLCSFVLTLLSPRMDAACCATHLDTK